MIRAVIFCLVTIFPTSVVIAQGAQGRSFAVQLEAFTSQEMATQRVIQLRGRGTDAYVVKSDIPGKGVYYRVRIGRYGTQAEAKQAALDFQRRGVLSEFFVAAYEKPIEGSAPASSPSSVAAPTAPAPPASAVTKVAPAVGSKMPSPATPVSGKRPESSAPVVAAKGGSGAPPPAAPGRAGTSTMAPSPSAPNTAAPTPPTIGGVNSNAATARNFVRFSDQLAGYSFERPISWEGGALDQKESSKQNIHSGAIFRSKSDSAFVNVIWNEFDGASNGDNDNDLIIDIVLRSMSSGQGTRKLRETGRKIVNENGQVRTYLDLKAEFDPNGSSTGTGAALDFLGKAVIVRSNKGILLVVTFYSKSSPSYVPGMADRISASVAIQ